MNIIDDNDNVKTQKCKTKSRYSVKLRIENNVHFILQETVYNITKTGCSLPLIGIMINVEVPVLIFAKVPGGTAIVQMPTLTDYIETARQLIASTCIGITGLEEILT